MKQIIEEQALNVSYPSQFSYSWSWLSSEIFYSSLFPLRSREILEAELLHQNLGWARDSRFLLIKVLLPSRQKHCRCSILVYYLLQTTKQESRFSMLWRVFLARPDFGLFLRAFMYWKMHKLSTFPSRLASDTQRYSKSWSNLQEFWAPYNHHLSPPALLTSNRQQ
jgi:hypothetical protein